MDTPMHGKRVGICVRRQRFRCRDCGDTFQQLLPDMDEKRHMTKRLIRYIEQRSLQRTFTEIAADVGLDEKTVRNIFRDHVETLRNERVPEPPEWLGIDELRLLRRLRCILCDVKRRKAIDLLEDRAKPTVIAALSSLPEKSGIKLVTMDMWNTYRQAVRECLPDAHIVVDRFHVVRIGNQCLNAVRKDVCKSLPPGERRKLTQRRFVLLSRGDELDVPERAELQEWLSGMPRLFCAYKAKEGFLAIYDSTSRTQAVGLWDCWLAALDDETRTAFQPLITAVKNWREEIFAFFDFPATNGYTEALNGVIKVVNRAGRGYSLDAIKAKLLFGGMHRLRIPRFGEANV
jgi:transposase